MIPSWSRSEALLPPTLLALADEVIE